LIESSFDKNYFLYHWEIYKKGEEIDIELLLWKGLELEGKIREFYKFLKKSFVKYSIKNILETIEMFK